MRDSILEHCPRILRTLLAAAVLPATLLCNQAIASAQGAPTEPAPSAATPKAKPEAPSAPAAPEVKSPTKSAAPEAPTPASDSPAAAAPAQDAPPADAGPTEEDKAAASEALEKGRASYQSGDYVTAAAHFAASQKLAPSPEAQFLLAMSLDLQGKATEAVDAFSALFADPTHTQLPPEQLEPAKKRYQVLQSIPASVTLHVTPPNALLSVDGQEQAGQSPFALKLPAGKHQLSMRSDGFESVETELEVKPAQTIEQAVELKPLPKPEATPGPVAKPEPAAPPPAKPRSKVPAYVTLGVAGAGAIVGTIFGIQALGAKSDFEDNRTTANADEVERNALIADMAFGVAITLGITGVVLLTTDEPAESGSAGTVRSAKVKPKRNQASLHIAPYFSPTGGGAAARATF